MKMTSDRHGKGTIRGSYAYEQDALVGSLTHEAIGRVLGLPTPSEPADFPVLVLAEARSLIKDKVELSSHRSRILMRVATFTNVYINRYRPGSGWEFLGAELPLDSGRIDLAWMNDEGFVFFDELKTTRHGSRMSPADKKQVEGYTNSGFNQLGEMFLGVRFLPLMYPASAKLVTRKPSSTKFQFAPLITTTLNVDAVRESK